MTDGETRSICGFDQYDHSMCRQLSLGQGLFCVKHNPLTCAGCGKRPARECDHTNDNQTYCTAPLCDGCEHRLAEGHGPKISVRAAAHESLVAAFKLSLLDAAQKGMCTVPESKADQLAAKVLNDVSLHVTMQVLSGMAAGPE